MGRNRAKACRDKLQELNTAVTVTASSAPLTPEFLSTFKVGACTARGRALDAFQHRLTLAAHGSGPANTVQLPMLFPGCGPARAQGMKGSLVGLL